MEGLELFAHATNTHGNTGEDAKSAEEFLEEIRESQGDEDRTEYTESLEKALLYEAGFDVLEVGEAYE